MVVSEVNCKHKIPWHLRLETKEHLIKYRNDNRIKRNEWKREWARLHPEYSRKSEEINKEKRRLQHQKKYLLNKKENNLRSKNWRVKNKARMKELQTEWRKKHPDYYVNYNRLNPRASRSYSIDMQIAMNNVRKRDDNTCQWLGCNLKHKETTVDVHHIFPISEYPELAYMEKYMICYCREHHAQFHAARGDVCRYVLSGKVKRNPINLEVYK